MPTTERLGRSNFGVNSEHPASNQHTVANAASEVTWPAGRLRGNMDGFITWRMIPALQGNKTASRFRLILACLFIFFNWLSGNLGAAQAGPPAAPVACLSSGDGYLRTRVSGSIDAVIDWPNAGTRCEGEERPRHEGVSLSFRRDPGSAPDLLFVFGVSHAREGQSAHGLGVNLTVILQGTAQIYGTLGESRCTVDSLTQTRLKADAQPRKYRIEARGFCTQPAHAVRGDGAVLLTTFDFAGAVTFDAAEHTT